MKATMQYGVLIPINNCDIVIGSVTIPFYVLPEITDSKSSHYNDEPVIGRSFPIKTFAYGDNRTIGMKIHFVTLTDTDALSNLEYLRAIQSAAYPGGTDSTNPYQPPPICKIRCGKMLTSSNEGYLCAVLKSYSVSFPTDVVMDDLTDTLLPYKFDVDCQFDVVFASTDLPGNNYILQDTTS